MIKFFLENSLLTKCNWSAILNGHVFLFGTSAVEYLLAIFLKPAIFSLFLYHNSFSPSEMILAFCSILAYSCAFRPLLTSPEPLSICGKLDFTAIDFLVEQALSVRCVQGDHVCVAFFNPWKSILYVCNLKKCFRMLQTISQIREILAISLQVVGLPYCK